MHIGKQLPFCVQIWLFVATLFLTQVVVATSPSKFQGCYFVRIHCGLSQLVPCVTLRLDLPHPKICIICIGLRLPLVSLYSAVAVPLINVLRGDQSDSPFSVFLWEGYLVVHSDRSWKMCTQCSERIVILMRMTTTMNLSQRWDDLLGVSHAILLQVSWLPLKWSWMVVPYIKAWVDT